MKRFFSLLLVMGILLCACGKTEPVETTPTTETTVPKAPVETTQATEPATEPTTVETTAPTEAVVIRHPLTGRALDAPFVGRVATFTINNAPAAMPQSGIANADWLYEIETEGGVTRCLGLFTDFSDVGNLGPIRSARTYFNNVTLAYDGVLFHCGGSPYALKQQYDDRNTFSNWNHVNEMTNSNYFFRDMGRSSSGYAWEHCLFTSGEKATQAMTNFGYYGEKAQELDFGLAFSEAVDLDGTPATEVKVSFLGTKTTTLTYDAQSGKYVANQYGEKWLDQNIGEAVSFNNVLVLQTEQWKPENYHSFYRLEGEGTGYMAINGEITEIRWSHPDVYSPFAYTLTDGTPIVLNAGNTYCAIVSNKGNVSYQ